MCGLFGTYHDHAFDADQRQAVMDMLRVGMVRGSHGTGLLSVNSTTKEHSVFKAAWTPDYLMRKEGFKEFIEPALAHGNILMGHHRHATKGEITDANAHPFTHGNITLMHNGTLTSGVDMTQGDVDSDLLCKLISEVGAEEAFAKILGAYVCFWWDAGEKRLFMIKNSQRTLSMLKTRSNLFWASEQAMLDWIVYRSYLGLNSKDVSHYTIENDVIYSLHDGELRKEVTVTKKPQFTVYGGYTGNVGNYKYRNNQGNRDSLAECSFLSEDIKMDSKGITYFRYIGISDKSENVFVALDYPLEGYATKDYSVRLKFGHRMNNGNWIDPSSKDTAIFYEIDDNSILELVPTEEEEKVPTYFIQTSDKYPLSKSAAKRFSKRGCVACKGHLMTTAVNYYSAFTDRQDKVQGLFCIGCTEAFKVKKQNEIIHLPVSTAQ